MQLQQAVLDLLVRISKLVLRKTLQNPQKVDMIIPPAPLATSDEDSVAVHIDCKHRVPPPLTTSKDANANLPCKLPRLLLILLPTEQPFLTKSP